uniref:Uncharacterized protein n=1 Tax=Chromera velia CCMP2878 TaxID=1169474 RepID=A0A0G4H5F0_9ALVE|eukprot:Cvel_5723.t1-p1 / transcript=Cvel_5723.t1 / gene=Cvel_5723 / organism=Chromera_velia_CCMP2878 / gene_product=Uncharacterized protein C20orf26, putative / transcript_product=Uncharacterized protein C20orf26, putative / location=Cvel_scaffold271:36069-48806(+) / protein_length=1856 / sequence_SO=supercontig / SO=protein_coding / is_pseudo=false
MAADAATGMEEAGAQTSRFPEGVDFNVRRAVFEDADAIIALYKQTFNEDEHDHRSAALNDEEGLQEETAEEGFQKLFPHDPKKVQELLEMSYLCVVAEEQDGSVVGFAAFDDRPPRFVPKEPFGYLWEVWMQRAYGAQIAGLHRPNNSIWLKFFVGQIGEEQQVMARVATTVFLSLPDLDYILLLMNEEILAEEVVFPFGACFEPVKPAFNEEVASFEEQKGKVREQRSALEARIKGAEAKETAEGEEPVEEDFESQDEELSRLETALSNQQQELLSYQRTGQPRRIEGFVPPKSLVWSCSKQSLVAPMHVRTAKVEDHDELVTIFNEQSEVVTATYGRYFIAELIAAQTTEDRALVAEVDGRARGLLSVTTDVDLNLLSQCFDNECLDFFVKPAYMGRLRDKLAFLEQHRAEGGTDEDSPFGYTRGDYLQIAFAQVDGGVDALLELVHPNDDQQIIAMSMLTTLRMVELSEDVAHRVELGDSVLTLLWQAAYTEPPIDIGAALDPSTVRRAVTTLQALDFQERKRVGCLLTDSWGAVTECFEKIWQEYVFQKEAAAAEEKRAKEASEKKDKKKGGDGQKKSSTPPKDAKKGNNANPADAAEEKEEEDQEIPSVGILHFLSALQAHPDIRMSQEDLSKVVMGLHWWGETSLVSPTSTITRDELKRGAERLANAEEDFILMQHGTPTWLQQLPREAKAAVCVNLYCLDADLSAQSAEFLAPIFHLFPEKDWILVTQPTTAPLSPLLKSFTLVPPLPTNSFGHALFALHRGSLNAAPSCRYIEPGDLPALELLAEALEDFPRLSILGAANKFLEASDDGATEKMRQEAVANIPCLVGVVDSQVVCVMAGERAADNEVEELRKHFAIDDFIVHDLHVPEPGVLKAPIWLRAFAVNPCFERYARRMMGEMMRFCGCSLLLMETDIESIVSRVAADEFLQVPARHPARVKTRRRDPPKVTCFGGIDADPEGPAKHTRPIDHAAERAEALARSRIALSMLARREVGREKLQVTSRVVVVGASDCGVSFLDSLLSMPHISFKSFSLLAPGALEYHHAHHPPLLAGSASHDISDLRRLLLELRVRLLDGRMVQVDRTQRAVVLQDGTLLPYDYLVITAGLQDDCLHALSIRSWGVDHLPEGFRHVNGAISAADPQIRDLLVKGGTLIKSLIWNPLSYAVVYGRSLDAYCAVGGLIDRGVPPEKIIMVLPPRERAPPAHCHRLTDEGFVENGAVEEKVHRLLKELRVVVFHEKKLVAVTQDIRERLKSLIFEDWALSEEDALRIYETELLPREEAAEGGGQGRVAGQPGGGGKGGGRRDPTGASGSAGGPAGGGGARRGGGAEGQGQREREREPPRGFSSSAARKGAAKRTATPVKYDKGTRRILVEIDCRLLITAGARNVDPDVFMAVHSNGLVYNGRLVVDQHFQTTDPAIFAAGSLCTFSKRTRVRQKEPLRMDGFDGREIGSALSRSILRLLDPVYGDEQSLLTADPRLLQPAPISTGRGAEQGGDGRAGGGLLIDPTGASVPPQPEAPNGDPLNSFWPRGGSAGSGTERATSRQSGRAGAAVTAARLKQREMEGDKTGGTAVAAGGDSERAPIMPDTGRSGRSNNSPGPPQKLLPKFTLPVPRKGLLPGGLKFIFIHSCRGEFDSLPSTPSGDHLIATDTMAPGPMKKAGGKDGKGCYCAVTIDKLGIISSITYLGWEDVEVRAFWSLVGLSETFLNNLRARHASGDIPCLLDFLTDEWATCLFHDRFPAFSLALNAQLAGGELTEKTLVKVLDELDLRMDFAAEVATSEVEGTAGPQIPQEELIALRDRLRDTAQLVDPIRERLLEFLRRNTNILKCYFLPEDWAGKIKQAPSRAAALN